ncbi:putative nuclease HARBI1 [Bactrocera dorsalis]|uniref:Nuclease HARBI1 n=2 Tax=Bactrocera dorsalis TaxID=27457 RepID=A0A8N4QFG2_BACDO|nr:putative nuclease HARBI1 [Bactrocera dorsalis]
MPFIFSIACFEAKRRRKIMEIRRNRHLRNASSILKISEKRFIQSFRLSKELFLFVLNKLSPHLKPSRLSHSIQLAAVLRYLAIGSYQLAIAKDHHINIGRSTFGKILHKIIRKLEILICNDTITLKMTPQDMEKSKEYFNNKFQLPNIIACVDGTHIRIKKPVNNDSVYFNRKGYFSLNAMVVCNYNMEIIAVDCTHPGSCHDSFIWNNSQARLYFSRALNGHFVLADSGYALENFVLTPFRSAENGSPQHICNKKHAAARNIVERTIGLLKSRFRCMQRSLNYEPGFACSIINVCCALHNICRKNTGPLQDDYCSYDENFDYEDPATEFEDQQDGTSIRNEIAQYLSQ